MLKSNYSAHGKLNIWRKLCRWALRTLQAHGSINVILYLETNKDIIALGRSLVIFDFGNVAYGLLIQFAECLPWCAGSYFRAHVLQLKAASLDFECLSP